MFGAAAFLAAALPAWAQDASANGRPSLGAGSDDQDRGRAAVRARRQAALSRVLAMIGQRTAGRHLNTTQGDYGGRAAYFVQWQQKADGRVVIFVVDAETGQMLGRQDR